LLLISCVYLFKHSPVFLFPLYLERVMAILDDGAGMDQLMWITCGMVLILFANIPSHTWFVDLISKYIRGFEKTIRVELLRQLQFLSFRFHGESSSGEMQAKAIRDVEQVEQLVRMCCLQFPSILVGFCFATSVTIYREPLMILCFAIIIPLTLVISRSFRKVLASRNESFRKEVEGMSSMVSEMINMIPVTKSHGLEMVEMVKAQKRLDQLENKGLALDRGNAWFESSAFVTFQLSQLLCLLVTSYMVAEGWMGLPELVLYQTLFGMLTQVINQSLAMLPQISKGIESTKSLGEVMELDDTEECDGKRVLKSVRGQVSFCDVDFSYDERVKVLSGVNFNVWPGECVAIVGESGSGKSTIMNLIIGLYEPNGGSVSVDHQDMRELNLSSWRRNLAVVSQNVILFSGTLRDNICYGLSEVSAERLEEVVEAAQLRSVVEQLPRGLDAKVGENGVKLSGGQRQRIAIARALIRDPKVLILDEATSALDVISEKEVQKAIDEVTKGRTTFIVAHRLSTIRQAKRVIVMKEGRILEIGNQEELMAKKGEFHRLKSLQ
jgi:ATP-binding cassette subfamily B protein